MPRFTTFFAEIWRLVPRAAAILLLAFAMALLSSEASFASGSDDSSTAGDAASEAATEQATEAASEQAAEAASEQAAETAAEQASQNAADQAAEDAASRVAEEAKDKATSKKQSDSSSSPDTADGSGDRHSGADGRSGKRQDETGAAATASNDDKQGDAKKAASAAPIEIGLDLDGSELRAHEIVVLLDRKDENAIRKVGFEVVAQISLDSLGGELLRIRVPDAASTADALHAVQTAAPEAIAAANHVYRTADGLAAARTALKRARAAGRPAVAKTYDGLAGIIDTPVERTYPGLGTAVAAAQSFADGASADSTHGTAVADIIARQNVRLLAANVFAKDVAGASAATTDAILGGLNWLVSRGVAVINMSIEGPLDAALSEAIRRAQVRGCIVVAAAGNKGPAAPPVYPAAFPSVVAVTAIDKQDHVYRYANQGPYISFAALGVDIETALPPAGRQNSSGTSFAAPVVTALIAHLDRKATVDSARATLALLATRARHLGPPGRNPVFGLGALGSARPAYLGE